MINENQLVQKIETLLKGSSGFIVKIGNELSRAKDHWRSAGDIKPYNSLYTKLPFGMKVGEKYIAISKDDLVVKHLEHCPPSYHAIYDYLLRGKIESVTGLPAADVWKEIIQKQPYKTSPTIRIVNSGITPTSSRREIKSLLDEIADKAGKKTRGTYGGGLKKLPTLAVVPSHTTKDIEILSVNVPRSVMTSKQSELEEFQREVRELWKRTMKMSPKYIEMPEILPQNEDEAA